MNLSSKELNYVKDMLSWELLTAKKCYQYGHQEQTPNRKEVFFNSARVHKQNYLRLLNYLERNNNQQGGQTH